MARFSRIAAEILRLAGALFVVGCTARDRAPAPDPAARHLTLASVDCGDKVRAWRPVALKTDVLDGPVRQMVPVLSKDPRVALLGYGGAFVIQLHTSTTVVPQILAPIGDDPGTVSDLRAVRAESQGGYMVLDQRNFRLTWFDSGGRLIKYSPIHLTPFADSYGIDTRGAFAVESRPASQPFAPTTGSLLPVNAEGVVAATGTEFATASRHVGRDAMNLALGQRPLEGDPIVVPAVDGGVVLNSSDSLSLIWIAASGKKTTTYGGGARRAITQRELDSAAHAYGEYMLRKDPAVPEAYARRELFKGRPNHQLIDRILVLDSQQIAIRRTRACPDRQLWYRLTRDGSIAGSFTLPLALEPLVASGDTIFGGALDVGTVNLGWTVIGSSVPHAAH